MRLLILVLAMFGLAISLWMLEGSGRDLLRQSQASGWEKASGVVERWNVDHSRGDGDEYTPYLSYLYAVEGVCYRGSSISLDEDGVSGFTSYRSEERALQALSKYRLGSSVTVSYDTANPFDAVLDTSSKGTLSAWGCLLFVGPCMLFGSLVMFWCVESPKLSAAMALLTVGLYWNYYAHYDGNAEAVDGGPQVVTACQARIEANRAAWKSLKVGDPEESVALLGSGIVGQVDTGRGARLTRMTFPRTPQMEREAEVVMTQASTAWPKTVKSVHGPYLP